MSENPCRERSGRLAYEHRSMGTDAMVTHFDSGHSIDALQRVSTIKLPLATSTQDDDFTRRKRKCSGSVVGSIQEHAGRVTQIHVGKIS